MLLLEFFKHLNANCKLSNEEENIIIEMNHLIMSGINQQNNENDNTALAEPNSDLVNKYTTTLQDVKSSKIFLDKVKMEIDDSFDKLNSIMDSRNTLSNILKEFNNTTKSIMNEKEKVLKLKVSIEKIYKMYEESFSIEAFFENTKEDCVEKIRFISDYEAIENGINFFTLNSSYIEANHYLNTYNMLKRIANTRYYNYMSNSLQSFFNLFEGLPFEDELFVHFIPKNMHRKFYNFPKNYEKMKSIQTFFEEKSRYDYDVKKIIEAIKEKFIDQRLTMLKPFYQEIFSDIIKAFQGESSGVQSNTVYSAIAEISKMTILEIIFFTTIFHTKASENTYILQKLTSDIYSNLYNSLRPIIVSSQNLDDLFVLFDGFSDNFGIFFLNVLEDNKEEVNSKIIYFFSGINSNNSIEIGEDKLLPVLNQHMDKLVNIIKVSKILIRPTVLKLVQDIQEKIFFKINLHIKNGLIDLETDFPNLSEHEERIAQNYVHFSLFHFFLRRMAVVLELLKNKLDKQVLNELTVFAIDKFIALLNEEILKGKNLTFEFEIYIIQQILLAIKILEEFEVEAIQTGVDIDFYSITDGFRNNIQNLFANLNMNIKDMIINSAPKLFDSTRDFKKILYNKLLKSYKVLINLVNEFVFGRDVMDIVYKIRNKEVITQELLIMRIQDKKQIFQDLLSRFETIIMELRNQIRIIDLSISEKLTGTMIDNLCNILGLLRGELGNYNEFVELLPLIDKEVLNKRMIQMRDKIFNN